jgi:DNA primase
VNQQRSQADRDELAAIRADQAALLSQFNEVWRNGREFIARCPLHADKTPSLTIYLHQREHAWKWRCFPCGKGGDALDLLVLQGTSFPDAVRRLSSDPPPIKFAKGPRPDKQVYGSKGAPRGRIVATYDYRDEHGTLLYQVVRMEPKDFRQRRPDGEGGWCWRLGDVRRVLYKLPQLVAPAWADRTVYLVEGEKDADRLWSLGAVATTTCGGAPSWRDIYAESLRGRDVVLIPDNDEPGLKHMRQAYKSLRGIARSVRPFLLEGLPPKGDVSDWLNAGHSVEELPK